MLLVVVGDAVLHVATSAMDSVDKDYVVICVIIPAQAAMEHVKLIARGAMVVVVRDVI